MKAIASRFPLRLLMAAGAVFAAVFALLSLVQPLAGRDSRQGTLFASSARAEDENLGDASQDAVPADSQPQEEITQPPVPETDSIFSDDPVARLAQSLQLRQDELTAREGELDERERRLELLREQVETRIRELSRLREQLQTDILDFEARLVAEEQRRSSERVKEVKKWVQIYESMRPEGAAPVLAGLDDDLAVQVLSNMEPKKAGKIMDQMDPQRAIDLGAQL